MVFFTCGGCGESLKKNRVDKHALSCRSCAYVTCIDCSKDFWENDYRLHTSCITEDEKYGKSGFKSKQNKGDVRQQQWLEKIQHASETNSISKKAKDLLETLKDFDNIPRKKPKFMNFLKNSVRIYDTRLGEEVWSVFSAPVVTKEPAKVEESKQNLEQKKSDENPNLKRKNETSTEQLGSNNSKIAKKEKTTKDSEVKDDKEDSGNKTQALSFSWFKSLKNVVENNDGKISLKKLKKKVFAEYNSSSDCGNLKDEDELEVIFMKKLAKSKKLKIDNKTVVLAKKI